MNSSFSTITVLLICSVLLTSCSKRTEERPYDASEEQQQTINIESANDQDQTSTAEQNVIEQNNDVPLKEDKPKTVLSDTVHSNESVRKMVREANVSFATKDVVKTALAIDKMTFEAGGFVEQKDIDFRVVQQKSQNIADGKVKVFEKVKPTAVMTVRVPSERAASYVNQLLPLMFFLNEQQYSAKRYELKLLEEKVTQSQVVPNTTKNVQLEEINKLTQMEVQDRVRYSTIKIYMNQLAFVREHLDVDLSKVAQKNDDSFWVKSWGGIVDGWYFILDLIIILIKIWPMYLLLLIGFFIYRLFKPFLDKLK